MKIKKILLIIFCFAILTILCSCNSSNRDLHSDFLNYYSDKFEKYIFHTPNGTEMYVLNLEKENIEHNPKVILHLSIGLTDDELKYQWLQKTPDKRKTELQYCANLVIDYAKNSGWKNDYYLYVVADETNEGYGYDMVYDYEQDKIYIPNSESIIIQMYEQFGTFDKSKILDIKDGKNFLLQNGFVTLKHNEIETQYTSRGYTVYILDGEFKESFKKDSTVY